MNKPLTGKGIVVTRPAHQADRLASLIRSAGGQALLYPVIEIRDIEDPRSLDALIDGLDAYDIAIFISPNAVSKAMALITARRALPPTLLVAAIGSASERELVRFGASRVIVPPARTDSEALLDLPQLIAAAGKRVIVFRGVGGRGHLGDTLRARGARVEYAECYIRARPGTDPAPLLAAWQHGELHAVTVTSVEGLTNFMEMVGAEGLERLARTPVFAPHPRIAQAARERGLANAIATKPGDEGMVEGLVEYFKGVTSDR
jgi:uroporphyrinogen-III synthase